MPSTQSSSQTCPRCSQLCSRLGHLCPRSSQICPRSSQLFPRLIHLCPPSSQLCPITPSFNPWTDLADGLNDTSSPNDVPFGVLMTTHNFKGLKPLKTQKGCVEVAFSSQTGKVVTCPPANIGSTPNFHTTTEQHSRLRGWSKITKFQFKMADGRHIGNVRNATTRQPMYPFE